MFNPKNHGVEMVDEVKVRGFTVIIVKIASSLGSFAGYGFTIPKLLMEGGGYSSPEMAIKTVEMFLSAPANPIILALSIILTLLALFV